MSKHFAYVRVSTVRQKVEGVSLDAQRDAIEHYAARNNLTITRWFSESTTAAKQGRREFNEMLSLLRDGKADGVIIHKIDRSARNLRDWVNLAELSDAGIEIHLAGESLDLNSRGGRLSADIQAVVAADYVRNLKQEARKGIRGRYKQGLLPHKAPIGYLDNGGGKPKTIDPKKAPLIREMFERYATGTYSLKRLATFMNNRGFTNNAGNPVEKNAVARILHNPFYTGVIHVKATGELFDGVHEPMISTRLFDEVQLVFEELSRKKNYRHTFSYRKLLTCARCGSVISPERQKGHVYYRCHTPKCKTRCLREEVVDDAVSDTLASLCMNEEQLNAMRLMLKDIVSEREDDHALRENQLALELARIEKWQNRLTDLLLDASIDDERYRLKNNELILKKKRIQERIQEARQGIDVVKERLEQYFELAKHAYVGFELASDTKKHHLVHTLTSNRTVDVKNVAVKLRKPFKLIADACSVTQGGEHQDVLRSILTQMMECTPTDPSTMSKDDEM